MPRSCLLLLLIGLLTAQGVSPAVALAETSRATVLSIGDGDTIRVQQGTKKLTVRLACIDAPEMAQAPYGQQARSYLQQRLAIGREVTLQTQTIDKYGRTVAEVISDININLAIVEDGQAFAYRKYLAKPPAIAMAFGSRKVASLDPGIFGVAAGVGPRPMAAPVPKAAVPLATITAAMRSVPMPMPRSYCGRATPIWMATAMGWLAKACAEELW
jgi:hypothetical protein